MSASLTSFEPSATPSAAAALPQRLGEQLQSLSQVGELLTLRLLELEERLSLIEARLSELEQAGNSGASSQTDALLAATEERIALLEDLLTGGSQPTKAANATVAASASVVELNPFPEEGEQPFMDELSA